MLGLKVFMVAVSFAGPLFFLVLRRINTHQQEERTHKLNVFYDQQNKIREQLVKRDLFAGLPPHYDAMTEWVNDLSAPTTSKV